MLLDKGFYDYDYKPLSEIKYKPILDLPEETEEETQKAWSRYVQQSTDLTTMSMEELQRHAINDIENKG